MKLTDLSDDEILARLRATRDEENRLQARFIALLVEVEERRLHLRSACPSVYEFCKQELAMSDGAAHRRSVAAQLVRRFPSLLDAIERGALHLSSLCLLRGHLRTENVEELVERCAGKSARDVAELLAARAPRPDVPATIAPTSSQAIFSPPPATPTSEPARIAPLAKERFEMRITISRELRDKLQRARDLMRHANPKDDLERVLDAAIDALVAKLEKRRLAKTERPQAKTRGSLAGRVAAAVRRAVFDRDGTRCTYVGANGKRCTSCTWLEIDHILPRADGGSDELRNLRVRCRAHNRLWAEERFGKQHVERSIALRRRSWDRDGADLALRGLVLLGFPKRDASSAIAKVAETHSCDEQPLPKEEIVREALRWLT